MKLSLSLAHKSDKGWAEEMVTKHHYLHCLPHPQSRPMTYVVHCGRDRVGLIMVGLPHATKNKQWWGVEGKPTQWQVVDLSRIWLDPRVQRGGEWCRPEIVPGFWDRKGNWRNAAATWAIDQVLGRIQEDRISYWPPVFLDQPYHIKLVISYHDPQHHAGTIYRQMGFEPMYTDDDGKPVPSRTGKYGWCWSLPEPCWEWDEIELMRPRNLRLLL